MVKAFREIDYSGDIGIEARGGSIEMLFCNAARGLFGLMARGKIRSANSRKIQVRSNSYEELLVDWLSEIISSSASNAEVYSDASIEECGEYFLRGTLWGERVDAGRHDLRFEVKAATYHDLYIKKISGGYKARIIFDL
jgi:SHS2 domain-containing protein